MYVSTSSICINKLMNRQIQNAPNCLWTVIGLVCPSLNNLGIALGTKQTNIQLAFPVVTQNAYSIMLCAIRTNMTR